MRESAEFCDTSRGGRRSDGEGGAHDCDILQCAKKLPVPSLNTKSIKNVDNI